MLKFVMKIPRNFRTEKKSAIFHQIKKDLDDCNLVSYSGPY